MDDSIYQAPESDLGLETERTAQVFYVVALPKFLALSFATMGMYSLYWYYKNWKGFKERYDESIWPVARAIFAIFFVYSLFGEIDQELKKRDTHFSWQPGLLAVLLIVLMIANYFTQFFPVQETYILLLQLLMGVPEIIILCFTQRAVNIAEGFPKGESNSHFSLANFLWVFLGLAMWGFMLLGALELAG